jgi:molecular chaperone GrpE
MYIRVLADFAAHRSRVERERASAVRSGKRDLILPLLEIADGLDQASGHFSGLPSPLTEGISAIQRKLLKLLEAQGVTPVKAVGERFNPEIHSEIGEMETNDHEPGSIVDELQRGYRWDEEVLRPALVLVAKKTSASGDS